MEWEKLKNKLTEYGYTKESIKKIKDGRQLPTAVKLFELKELGVPFRAWKPYIEKYTTSKKIME